ncbi:MAG: catalase family peroxidase [Acidobacteriaceae bacterium]|nr:catalase family peroxidase [Acidobacteriaceae bacterium]
MPLPNDEALLALSQQLLDQFQTIFGEHPGFRPAHAKGIMLTGTFEPTAAAAGVSRAQHLNQPSTPVVVRFSNSTGLPLIPDNDPNANPRGFAIRFMLADHVHTDIVSHSTDGFPTRTGAEFLEFLRALVASDPAHLDGSPLEAFFGAHPEALAFVKTPKPTPASFATDTYFGVTAMKFLTAEGKESFGRYRILPAAGNQYADEATLKEKPADFLMEEIVERVSKAPVVFQVQVQLAGEGDVVDDATKHWPEDRPIVDLGTLTLTAPVEDTAVEQKHIIFDPIPRTDGIEPSDDPLLELRAAIYLISGRKRRKA